MRNDANPTDTEEWRTAVFGIIEFGQCARECFGIDPCMHMNTAFPTGILSLMFAIWGVLVSALSGQAPDVPETFPNGVVYGPKAAFAIAAPWLES